MSCKGLERYQFKYVGGQLASVFEYFDASGNAIIPPTEYQTSGSAPTGFTTWAAFLESLQNDCKDEAEVFVVRLHGDVAGTATEVREGDGFTGANLGNTYTLTGEYLSYDTAWMGDTNHNETLDWNGITYRAGIGSGSARYAHSQLPALTDPGKLIHDNDITLTVSAGAFVEFRFKRLQN